jgi:hypothetical protein
MITGIDGHSAGRPGAGCGGDPGCAGRRTGSLRLPLGDDAVDGVLGHLDQVADEVGAWEHLARATPYPTTPESIGSAG